jgi:formate dehydrogenase major subunit
MIMGSNMAECHPVAFRWPMQAKLKGAKIIHVDPRFTRTSAMSDIYAPIRAGTDVVFLGALIKYVIEKIETSPDNSFHRQYVTNYTNAALLINKDFKDTEDLDGLFSGWNDQTKAYSNATWSYQRAPQAVAFTGDAKTFSDEVAKTIAGRPLEDRTLKDPQAVFQILKRHYARYTPAMVERVCGCPQDKFLQVAETLWANSNAERTSSIVYAVGWTQHTIGVQFIRAAGILQQLLGNIGRPGGGILALRGHATIQGSTDIATLYHSLPGYLPMPDARKRNDTFKDYVVNETVGLGATSFWSNFPKFAVSYFKAQFGNAATAENGYGYDSHPKITGDHSHMPMFVDMAAGRIKGFLVMGQNPAVGGQNARFQRKALAKLEWMVVRDSFITETAEFWKSSPEVQNGELNPKDIKTEVFFLPSAILAEMEGSFTNTQRLLQWHDKAADPPDDARSDSWFSYHLGKRLKALYRTSTNKNDWAIQNLLWDYEPDAEEVAHWRIKDEPSAFKVLKEINGYEWATKQQLASFVNLREDGGTAGAAWIYTGVVPDAKTNNAARRKGDDWISPQWGFAWPANRHIMYNRASAAPDGKPWSERKKLIYWDENFENKDAAGNVTSKGRWISPAGEVPDFNATKPPTTKGKDGVLGWDYQGGEAPFLMRPDGKALLFAPAGLVDGPLPTHYEPYESPVVNVVYKQQSSPTSKVWNIAGNEYHKVADPEYPIIISTYRLTEHHLSGTMSRFLPWLAELMPELFCEISPELAQAKGINNTDYVTIKTKRGTVTARALVTRRMRPFNIDGKVVHEIGLPWHWGWQGNAKGDVVNNLSALVGDPNVSIHEAKVFTCDIALARSATRSGGA